MACIASSAGVEVYPGGRHGAERTRFAAARTAGCARGATARANGGGGACGARVGAAIGCAGCCR
eukprot:4550655-Pleurochrysis_carterae.AAC.1